MRLVEYALKGDLMTAYAVRAASSLGVFSECLTRDWTSRELAAKLDLDEQATEKLLSLLATVGIFVPVAPLGTWALSSEARQALSNIWLPALSIDGFGTRLDAAATELVHTLRTGRSAYEKRYGGTLWSDLSTTPDFEAGFHEYMDRVAQDVAPILADAYDWGSVHHVVDVGGGLGGMLRYLLHRFPTLHGTIFDQPSVIARARHRFAEDRAIGGRIGLVAGDFLRELPHLSGDYLLCQVLHDWPDADVSRILSCVRNAMTNDSRALVVERIPEDGLPFVHYMSFRMLMLFGAGERGVEDYEELAKGAGFLLARTARLDHGFVCLELVPKKQVKRDVLCQGTS